MMTEQWKLSRADKREDILGDSIREWRAKATNVYSLFMAVAMLLPVISVFVLDATTAAQNVVATVAWLFVLGAAFLRRLGTNKRVLLMVIAAWIVAASMLMRGGIYLNFRMPMINIPMMVLMLSGVRMGLSVGIINICIMLFAVWGTKIGWLPQTIPPWNEAETGLQYVMVIMNFVPQILLLTWFSHHLTTTIRSERLATVRLQEEAERRRRLEGEIMEAGERVSRHIGSELHDGVCQDLTGLMLRGKRAQKALAAAERPEADVMGGIVQGLGDAIGEIHGLSQRLSPGFLTGKDLSDAIEIMVQRFSEAADATIEFKAEGDEPVPDSQTTQHLYRIAQEAISNAVRHSGASRIDVSLTYNQDMTVLRVDDDGHGLELPDEQQDGLGRKTMNWRASVIGGTLVMESKPGSGSRVECRVPMGGMEMETKDE